MFSSLRGLGRLRWIVLGGVLLLVGAGAAAAVVLTSAPGDVSHPDVEFTQDEPQAPAPPASDSVHPFDDGFAWPVYGYTKQRTSWLALDRDLRPPFAQEWAVTGRVLTEFTPVLCGRSLYQLKNNGALYAISRVSGRVRWKRKLGTLAAASPACAHNTVYAVLLTRGKGINAGRVAAVEAATGRTRWSRKIPSRVESSPLLDSGRLYFGSEDGTVYAMRASDGAVRWRYRAAGAVKGGLALADGKLFFGDYAGYVQAIRRADGRRLWRVSGAGTAFGLRSGRFYSTPAVAYGRVYIGGLDGFVYSFAARNGRLAWRHRTGGFVYSSPAVASVHGAGPTVYIGSYDGRLYALDARSGRVRWMHDAGGRISGGTVVLGDLVLYSNLARRSTAAVGARTGKVVWRTERGAFNPVISDGRRIYLAGYSSLFALAEPAQARRDARVRLRDPVERRRARNRAKARAENRHNRYARKLVCFTRKADDRTICRPRKGSAGGVPRRPGSGPARARPAASRGSGGGRRHRRGAR